MSESGLMKYPEDERQLIKAAVLAMYKRGCRQSEIVTVFGMTSAQVSRIVNGRTECHSKPKVKRETWLDRTKQEREERDARIRYAYKKEKMTYKQLCEMFGVSKPTVECAIHPERKRERSLRHIRYEARKREKLRYDPEYREKVAAERRKKYVRNRIALRNEREAEGKKKRFRRPSISVEYNGMTLSLKQLEKLTGISVTTFRKYILDRGHTAEEAVALAKAQKKRLEELQWNRSK